MRTTFFWNILNSFGANLGSVLSRDACCPQQYASPCRWLRPSSSSTHGSPVDGLWPLIRSSVGASATAVKYMSHMGSGRSISIIFSFTIRLFSMFRRLYLNSTMVLVYRFSAVTAEPMQVPKEHHAKLREKGRN